MRRRNPFTARVGAFLLGVILGGLPAYAATANGGYLGHRVVAGDFNGDGWLDLILQALPGFHGNAELLADSQGDFDEPVATWPDRHLNMDWNAIAHQIAVGDFNGDGRDDLFLQANTEFASAVLLADTDGRFRRVAATPRNLLGGLDLTTADHDLVVGDFNGDGRDDLLLQAKAFTDANGIALARSDGTFHRLDSNWNDGMLGLSWSSDRAALTAGDFNGDGRAGLLVRSVEAGAPGAGCCSIVTFDTNAKPAAKLQDWAVNYLGINWQPSANNVIAGDFNGDRRSDLLVQPVAPGGDVYVLLAGKDGHFTVIADRWPSERDGVDWSAESYLLVLDHKASGKGGSLLMIPKEPGLPYRRASFSAAGRLVNVTTLAGPPADALAAVSGGASGAGQAGRIAPHLSPHVGGGTAVGAADGSFSVDPQGGAAYSIPITVAPGVNGLAPDLALAYNSRSGDNQLGLGWSLSGLSAISRCPKTFASDGTARPVMIDSDDEFCLDGMHLYLKSGHYGWDGAEYYTKPATFQQVISHTSDNGNGPQSFTVKDKAGLIREYGATADSAIGAGNNFDGRTVAWLLDRITDRHNNFIKFHYVKSQGPGNADIDYYLSEVDYGNNAGTTVGTISFDYDKRSINSSVPFFSAGLEHLISELLTKVTVTSAGSTIRTYTLDYDQQTGFPPELTSVQECGADGSCFPATTFTYAPVQSGFGGSWTTYVNPNGAGNIHVGDIDGDGRTDLIFTNGSDHWCVVLATDQTMDCTTIGQGEAPQDALVADINSDGYDDMLVPVQGDGGVHQWRLLLSDGSTLTRTDTYINNYDSLTNHPTIADLNGDGYPDLVLKKNGVLYYYLNSADGLGNFDNGVATQFDVVGEQHLIPIRFRGGQQEAVFVTANGCDSGDGCQNSLGAFSYDDSTHKLELTYRATGEADSVIFLDINGDGLSDMMVYGTSTATFCGQNTWCLYLNHGGSFSGPADWSSNSFASTDHPASSIVMDYTGDGRDDLLVPANEHGWTALYADWYSGSVIQLDKEDSGIQHDVASHPAFAIDYKGKGTGDLLQNRNNTWQVRAHAGSAWPTTAHGGELTSITNGLGEVTSIDYGSIAASPTYASQNRFYSPDPNEGVGNGSGADAVREFDGPLYVVTGISTTVSSGYTLATSYYWYGARLDRSGRGFLGFAKQKATSNGDHETTAVYRLEYPYTGMITSLTKSVNGNPVTDVENSGITTKSTDYGPFPYVGTSTEHDYELGAGSAYKTVTTTDQYDDFGNDTLHKVVASGGGETSTVTTTNQYHNNVSPWCLGRLYDAGVVYSGIGQSRSRHSTFTYDGTSCDLATESFEPSAGDVAALAWKKTLTRDGVGNVHKETLQPINGNTNFTARTTTTDYDTQGRYPKDQLDALGNKTTYTWDQAEGVKTSETDPNGVTVSYSYDGFGRSAGSTGPYGNEATTVERQWCGVADCQDTAHSVYAVIATKTAGGETVTEYDDAGSKTTERSIGFGGQWSNTAYGYDSLGRNYLVSAPYLTGDTPCWAFTTFDALNRPLHVYAPTNENQCGPAQPPGPGNPPGGTETSYAYDGFTTTATTGSGETQHKTQTTQNVLGKTETVKRMLKGPHTGDPGLVTVQSIAYDAAGNETAVTDAAGETVTLTYDAAGKYRTGRSSPTSGAWTYTYDALGELTGQSDASGNVTTQHYNTLGQMTQRAVTDGDGNTTTTAWTYGASAASHNVEKLTKVSQSDGWQETYAYNAQSDVNETTTTIDGTAYQVNTGYDSYGRVTSVTYPTSPAPPNQPPVAVASASPTNVTSARTVTLDGTGSHDPDGGPEPLSYQWTVDQKPAGENTVTITDAGSAVAHVSFDADDVNGDYVFKLTVGDGDATGTDTATVTVNIPPAKPKDAPSLSPKTSHNGFYTVSWDKVENADTYKLQERKDGGSWSPVYSGSALSWQPAQAKGDGDYGYEVRACTPCSPWSAEATEHVVIIPPPPASLTANPNPVYSGGLYYMSWPAVHPTPSYYLLQSDEGGTWHQVYQGSDTYSQNFTAPSTYPNLSEWIQYRVEACSANGCSDWTNGVEHVQCAPDIRTCNVGAPAKGHGIDPHAGTARLALHYEYDEAGEVVQAYTTDITHPVWTATGADAAGHVTMAAEGNNGAITLTRVYDRATGALTTAQAHGVPGLFQASSYGYDAYGNLISRADNLPARGETETYQYDSFDRLAIATADIPNVGEDITTASAAYTVGGDLLSRTDAAGSFGYTYGNGNQPHRLTQVSGALAVALGYDGAGRVTGSAALAIAYDGRGLATTITRHGHQSALRYDPAGHEYEETRDGKQTITLIAGGAFRVIEDSVSGVTSYRQALVVNGAVIGQVVNSSANGTRHYEFFATDNIGSVTEVADASGTEIEGFSYDPFGRRREAVDWKTIVPIEQLRNFKPSTRRGYTGGEMLDETGMVLLGARVYAPELGRWLSPDPAGLGSPYVYVGNNPESDTDPTGALSGVQVVEIAALVAITVVTAGSASALTLPMIVAIGAGEGFATGFIASGGNFRAGLIGAAGGAAFGAIGGTLVGSGLAVSMERAGLEGFVGGALTEANGGRFSDGFLGAFAASAGEGMISAHVMHNDESVGARAVRTATAAAVGGTVSRITGGSFANGAWSAAFQHMFNCEAHNCASDRENEAANNDETKQLFKDKQFHEFKNQSALAGWMGKNGVAVGIRPLYIWYPYLKAPIVFTPFGTDQLFHEQLFYTNSKGRLFNSGYFKGTGIGTDPHFPGNIRDYHFIPIGHDIPLNLYPSGFTPNNYNVFWHNCQDYICHVLTPDSGGQ